MLRWSIFPPPLDRKSVRKQILSVGPSTDVHSGLNRVDGNSQLTNSDGHSRSNCATSNSRSNTASSRSTDPSRSGRANRSSARLQTPRDTPTIIPSEPNASAADSLSVLSSRKRRRCNPSHTERFLSDNPPGWLEQSHSSTPIESVA